MNSVGLHRRMLQQREENTLPAPPLPPESESKYGSWGRAFPVSQVEAWKARPWWRRWMEWPDGSPRALGFWRGSR